MTAIGMARGDDEPVDVEALVAENAKLKDYLKRVVVTLEEHQAQLDDRPVAAPRLLAIERSLARVEQDLHVLLQYVRGGERRHMTAVD